jgi:hypothetical protein
MGELRSVIGNRFGLLQVRGRYVPITSARAVIGTSKSNSTLPFPA